MAKKSAPKAKRAPATKKPGQAVAIAKPQALPAPLTFLEFLDRAARDPAVDVGKMQALLDMKAKEDDRNAAAAFDFAMSEVQKDMQPIRTDMESAKPKNKYASHVKLDRYIRPIYSRHGFAVSYDNDECPHPLTVRVVAYVTCAGHKRRYFIDIPADGKGPSGGDVMSRTHAVGSANTYGKGILLRNIFNLVVDKRDDDDGAAAGGAPVDTGVITAAQRKEIDDDLKATNSDLAAFLYMLTKINGDVEIKDTASIPAALYETAVAKLAQKKAAMATPK